MTLSPEAEKSLIKQKYRELLHLCRPYVGQEDIKLIKKAYLMGLSAHRPKWNEKPEEYIYHSVEVARIVSLEIGLGSTAIISALLHNVVDNDNITLEEIEQHFGKSVAVVIRGFSKISDLPTGKVYLQSENFRRLFLSLVGDIRVILIKLAHRLNDLRNFSSIPEENKTRFLQEAAYLYAPIAHRLGLYNIKSELEELSMKYCKPEIYNSLSKKIQDTEVEREKFIRKFFKPIQQALENNGYDCEIRSRLKSIHSIWNKMQRQNVTFEEVYDLFAVRIIVNKPKEGEKSDCWRIYSIVTDIYSPNPKRLRDWISAPKASGYESLHTTVKGPENKWVEVQIRTKRMDEVAEKGNAAHWRYKELGGGTDREEWLNKIRKILENPRPTDLDEIDKSKIRVATDKIFVFTPKGDLFKLSSGASVLDFAYEIHSAVGSACTGARINGKIFPIRHILNNGDKVEIITSKNQKPNLDWLNYVVSSKAKSRIQRAIRQEKYKESEAGRETLIRKLKNWKIPFRDETIDKLVKHYKLSTSLDLYYLIATDKLDISQIKDVLVNGGGQDESRPAEKVKKVDPAVAREKEDGEEELMVIDSQVKNLNYNLAKCCNPVAGDPVFGFITVGKGITIHRFSCPNAKRLLSKYPYRIISVKWKSEGDDAVYDAMIQIVGRNEVGVLHDITDVISNDMKVNMQSLTIDTLKKDNLFIGKIRTAVKDLQHLEFLLHKLNKVNGVSNARRITS